jgi:hypothetical protein
LNELTRLNNQVWYFSNEDDCNANRAFKKDSMLIAEIRGHASVDIEKNEDYLTSAVFGHLRYVPPKIFWQDLFSRASSLASSGAATSLDQVVFKRSQSLSNYSNLEIYFWPFHPIYGEPDMLLSFTGDKLEPLVVIIEVKLWSEKSSEGEKDQLAKYLALLDDLTSLNVVVPSTDLRALVYLTLQDSRAEILESLKVRANSPADCHRTFRLGWQDVLVSAEIASRGSEGFHKSILCDVSEFLRRRGYEYFTGFSQDIFLPNFSGPYGTFYHSAGHFQGFARIEELVCFEVTKGAWT